MKPIIIFLSLFLIPLFADDLKNGFGEEYYKLDIDQKRQIFFIKMNEMFDQSFKKIEQERAFIEAFFKDAYKTGFRTSNQTNLEKLITIKNKYRIENLYDFVEYKKRIQKIPKSMGIAQALVESATGTSRFAREANNLFGEWTWGEKGLIPDLRHPDKKHKIKIFDSLQDSVYSYVLNLNRHFAYEKFRDARAKFASEGKEITGLEAIKTLDSYSERKGYYINLITKIIKRYNLEKYDTNSNNT
ncbi:mannosyl-glycoprotein endo-beta-N-acetylglucosamidase [Campylobacter jejuni]|uniref:glucosaminidase domain-containing protein n=1 Tax=Campylobacter jejuni TaxID=197 RepID=UPI000F813AB6|nr:glucosaminidase domain-containing protein [Campylobacter jejuni]EAH7569456.1 mannosyl-glycoprotein endo-beta-N-acetylglucosamidase [Campylobacter jejuni]EAH8618718.1 mannosyl-glycoprotein endo-beta-N-acetylglucosamidase [Campylobacter jejuni]EAI2807137.1 mannosyl-glycoprotein endo-beta-N-acetylglucosamidase [Campylobacter jejuni]EAI5615675.1 mannosyl-glycoprotein endo-beta-N-acetylglucosamidase [Campylobacter jejuni]EAI8901643.1 mannosyl-glycoprotein endo-beta-N-acetylglucosamidase [Campylo